jgi:predicted ArsR family transcriptional regulator
MSDSNGRGRPMKVTPAEVLDRIEQSGRITVEELAAILDVTPDTVRKKLRILRGDGFSSILTDSSCSRTSRAKRTQRPSGTICNGS